MLKTIFYIMLTGGLLFDNCLTVEARYQQKSDTTVENSNLKIAITLCEHRKYNEAIRFLSKARKEDPDNSTIYEYEALAYYNLTKYKESITVATEAISRFPGNSDFYFMRAITKLKIGDPKHSLLDFTKAIQLDSTRAKHFYFRAEANRQLNQNNSSLEDLLCAQRLFSSTAPEQLEIHGEKGEIELLLGRNEDAIKDIRRYLLLEGKNVAAPRLLGKAYLNLNAKTGEAKLLDSAIFFLEQFKMLGQLDYRAIRDLGKAYGLKMDSIKSRKNLEMAYALNSDDPETWLALGANELGLHHFERGKPWLEKVVRSKNSREKAKAYYNLGVGYEMLSDDSAKSMINFEKAERIDSTIIQIYYARSYINLWVIHGDYDLIMRDLKHLVIKSQSDKEKALAHYFIAQVYLRKHENELALISINDAIQLSQNDPSFYEMRALINLSGNAREIVWNDIEKSISIDSTYASIYGVMGYFYVYFDNDHTKGCESWQKAIDLGLAIPASCQKTMCSGKTGLCEIPLGPKYPKPTFVF